MNYADQRTPPPAASSEAPPATEKQLNYLRALAEERDIEEEARAMLLARIDANLISKKRASEFIARLQEKPRLRRADVSAALPSPEELPAGRYAVENEDGELRFYHLWRGTRRPEYVKLYVEHGPDQSEIPFKALKSILAKIIEADPREAAIRYGFEIGACSSCGLRLTNRLSRELGIGPVCGGRFYADQEEWTLVKAVARDAIRSRGEDPTENVEEERVGSLDGDAGMNGPPERESPPCMGCGRPEHTHDPGECVR